MLKRPPPSPPQQKKKKNGKKKNKKQYPMCTSRSMGRRLQFEQASKAQRDTRSMTVRAGTHSSRGHTHFGRTNCVTHGQPQKQTNKQATTIQLPSQQFRVECHETPAPHQITTKTPVKTIGDCDVGAVSDRMMASVRHRSSGPQRSPVNTKRVFSRTAPQSVNAVQSFRSARPLRGTST